MSKSSLSVFCDGGSRGNPGPAAVGFLIKDNQGEILVKKGKLIGQATNNVSEYMAVIEALKWLVNQPMVDDENSTINFFLDSKLVVNQLNGLFKIKAKNLRNLVIRVRQLEREIGGNVAYHFIRREKNRQADFLVNQTLNGL
jgi:ribonuclease HI